MAPTGSARSCRPSSIRVLMFDRSAIPKDDPERPLPRARAIELLVVVKEDEIYFQPCLSPVWDTALCCHALMEAGGEEAAKPIGNALGWLKPLQVLDFAGDWAAIRPDMRPGGWAFQYANPYYPDVDDTAVVVHGDGSCTQQLASRLPVAMTSRLPAAATGS